MVITYARNLCEFIYSHPLVDSIPLGGIIGFCCGGRAGCCCISPPAGAGGGIFGGAFGTPFGGMYCMFCCILLGMPWLLGCCCRSFEWGDKPSIFDWEDKRIQCESRVYQAHETDVGAINGQKCPADAEFQLHLDIFRTSDDTNGIYRLAQGKSQLFWVSKINGKRKENI